MNWENPDVQQTYLERTMSELGKQFRKSHQKTFQKTENQCQNAAFQQKTTSEKEKFV